MVYSRNLAGATHHAAPENNEGGASGTARERAPLRQNRVKVKQPRVAPDRLRGGTAR
jgi:hypothetical protein